MLNFDECNDFQLTDIILALIEISNFLRSIYVTIMPTSDGIAWSVFVADVQL